MSPTNLSKIESATRIVLLFHDALNRHDVDGIMQCLSSDCIINLPGSTPEDVKYSGIEEISHYWQEYFIRLPDVRREIEEIFGMGMRCVVRWKYRWTITDGSQKTVRGVDIFRVKNQLIDEIHTYLKDREGEYPQSG